MNQVVLVEGESDRAAMETLARRTDVSGFSVVSVGGASNFSSHLMRFGAGLPGNTVLGLYDIAERSDVVRAFAKAGIRSDLNGANLEDSGFFACDVDLEDEMIRALSAQTVEEIVEGQGELNTFRRMQRQPAWRAQPLDRQLHRFIGTRAGRKVRFGGLLAEAISLEDLPLPLNRLLRRMSI